MDRVVVIARALAMNSLAIGGLALFVSAAVHLSGEGKVAVIEATKVPKSVQSVPDEMLARSASRILPPSPAVIFVKPEPVKRVAAPAAGDLRPVVILDPGHGGRDGGTIAGGALEKQMNLDAATRVAKRLRKAGVRVVFTRSDDSYVSLAQRAMIANRFVDALFVSIHHNASTNESPRGVETYYTMPKSGSAERVQRRRFGARSGEAFVDRRGELLATEIQDAFALATGAVDRGIKNQILVVTRMVSCPAVLVECGFLSNLVEAKNLRSESYREKMSAGIAGGIMRYLNAVANQKMFGVSFPGRTVESGM